MRRLIGAGVSWILLPTIALSLTSARPATAAVQRWSPTGSLATAREGHTATLLPDGRVLVAGGFDGQIYLASAEIYDPASGTWSPTGSLATARDGHTATRLAEASAPCGLSWRRHRVWQPLWYELRPLAALVRGRRRPSRFDLWEAVVRDASP